MLTVYRGYVDVAWSKNVEGDRQTPLSPSVYVCGKWFYVDPRTWVTNLGVMYPARYREDTWAHKSYRFGLNFHQRLKVRATLSVELQKQTILPLNPVGLYCRASVRERSCRLVVGDSATGFYYSSPVAALREGTLPFLAWQDRETINSFLVYPEQYGDCNAAVCLRINVDPEECLRVIGENYGVG